MCIVIMIKVVILTYNLEINVFFLIYISEISIIFV